MKVKLAPGLKLRDPVTKQFVPEGEVFEVRDDDLYYQRRINDGDLHIHLPTTKKRSGEE